MSENTLFTPNTSIDELPAGVADAYRKFRRAQREYAAFRSPRRERDVDDAAKLFANTVAMWFEGAQP